VKNTHRANDIAAAHRRFIVDRIGGMVAHLAATDRARADRIYHEICVAVELLAGDEPAALARFIIAKLPERICSSPGDHSHDLFSEFRCLTCKEPRDLDATIGFLSRLLLGQASYGPLNLNGDPRNWQHEIEEELADAVAYRVFGEVNGAVIAAVDEVEALEAIGQRTDISRVIANTKIAQQHQAIGQLCEGGGLRFGWDATNKPPPLRCHQCGKLFELEQLEMAQRPEHTLIPEHEVRR
jgi:hypothetical protein